MTFEELDAAIDRYYAGTPIYDDSKRLMDQLVNFYQIMRPNELCSTVSEPMLVGSGSF